VLIVSFCMKTVTLAWLLAGCVANTPTSSRASDQLPALSVAHFKSGPGYYSFEVKVENNTSVDICIAGVPVAGGGYMLGIDSFLTRASDGRDLGFPKARGQKSEIRNGSGVKLTRSWLVLPPSETIAALYKNSWPSNVYPLPMRARSNSEDGSDVIATGEKFDLSSHVFAGRELWIVDCNGKTNIDVIARLEVHTPDFLLEMP
jgi:hypothetical protein